MGLFYPYREARRKAFIAGSKDSTSEGAATCSFTPYTNNPCDVLVGFADAGYLSDPHKGRSQTGYVFTMGNTAIS